MGGSAVIVREDPNQVEANVSVAQGAPGTTQLAAPVLGRRHRVKGFILTMGADGTLKFTSGGVDITGPMDFAGKGGAVEVDLGSLIQGTLNNDISIVSTLGNANGAVKIITEAP